MWCLDTFYSDAINYIKTQLSHCFKILKYYSAKTQKDVSELHSHYLRSRQPQAAPTPSPRRPAADAHSPRATLPAAGLRQAVTA